MPQRKDYQGKYIKVTTCNAVIIGRVIEIYHREDGSMFAEIISMEHGRVFWDQAIFGGTQVRLLTIGDATSDEQEYEQLVCVHCEKVGGMDYHETCNLCGTQHFHEERYCANCETGAEYVIKETDTPLCFSCFIVYRWGQASPEKTLVKIGE